MTSPKDKDNGQRDPALNESHGRGNPAPVTPLYDIYLLEVQTDGRFKPMRQLGQGSMGSVWLVWDDRLKVHRAIKILKFMIARGERLRSRFIREARVLAQLKHPHIITVYDFGQVKAESPEGDIFLPYIVMEFVTGGSLEDYLAKVKGPVPPRFAITQVMRPMLSALSQIHEKGFIHRDVKPANFLIDDGVVKLADFGIAYAEIEGATKGLTLDRDVLGTLMYMAPEQYKESNRADARSDLYSAGMILWEMLHGKKPELPLVGTRLAEDFQLLEGIPQALHSALCRVMHAKPEDRFATAKEFWQALEETLPLLPEDPIIVPELTIRGEKKTAKRDLPEEELVEDPFRANATLVTIGEPPTEEVKDPELVDQPSIESLTMMEQRAHRTLRLRRGILMGVSIIIMAVGVLWWAFVYPSATSIEPVAITEKEPVMDLPISVPPPATEVSAPIPSSTLSVIKTESKVVSKDTKPVAHSVKVEPLSEISAKVVISVNGDAKGVWLTADGVSHAMPGEVLPGTYMIEAQFDGDRMAVGSVIITEGVPITIGCQSAFAKCKRK